MFFNVARRLFDNANRGQGGIAKARPAWETTPANYPVKTLPWGAYFDASDNATIVNDGGSGVVWWRSALAHPYDKLSASSVAAKIALRAQGFNPQIGGGTANPANKQHISFNGTTQYFLSGARLQSTQFWGLDYSDTHGGGSNEGFWDSGTDTFVQTTPANVPNAAGGPRFTAANSDQLTTTATLATLFAADGSEGTITFAFYGDVAQTAALGTSTTQTPYANPALFSDSLGYFGIHYSTAGITAGAYDGVARDVGGGPNDGWQMTTVALANNTDAIVQCRFGGGTMELRVITASSWGAWTPCDFSTIAVNTGTCKLGVNYDGTQFLDALIYAMSTKTTKMLDVYADDEVRYIANAANINIGQNYNARPYDAHQLFQGGAPNGGVTPGYVAFTVARANSRTTSAQGYDSQWFWGTSAYYIGLASLDSSGAKWDSFAFDDGGAVDYDTYESIANDTWALMTSRLGSRYLKSRKNGDASTDTKVLFPAANPNSSTGNQYLSMGYSIGGAAYLNGAIGFFGSAPTNGWSEARIRDVERYLNAYYLTSSGSLLTRTISDTITVSDTIIRRVEFLRRPSDTATVSDTTTRTATFGRTISDTATLTDSIIRRMEFLRRPSDTATISDTATRNVEFLRRPSDTCAVTDATTRNAEFLRRPSDTISATDALARTATFGRTNNDTCAVSDALARTATFGRTNNDTCAVTDSLTRIANATRFLSDTCAVTDTTARNAEFLRRPSDTISATDSIASGFVFARTINDTITATDTLARTATFGRTNNDTCAVSDTCARTATFGRLPSDTCAVTDALARTVQFARVTSDTCAVTDALARTLTLGRTFSDTCAVGDSIFRVCDPNRFVADTCAVSDALARTVTFGRTNNDTCAVTDLAMRSLVFSSTKSDTIAVTDALARTLDLGRTRSDTCAVTDALTRVSDPNRFVADTCAVTETVLRTLTFSRVQSDTIAVSDAFARSLAFGRTCNDTISTTDTITREKQRVVGSDTCACTDALARACVFARKPADTIDLADSVSWQMSGFINSGANDTIAITDQLTRIANATRGTNDTAAVSDAQARTLSEARTPNDSTTIGDQLARSAVFDRRVAEVIALSDLLQRALQFGRQTAASITPSDALAWSAVYTRAPNDVVGTDDASARGLDAYRSRTDAVALTDDLSFQIYGPSAGNTYTRGAYDEIAALDVLFPQLYSPTPEALQTIISWAGSGPEVAIVLEDGAETIIALEDGPQTEIRMTHELLYDVGDVIEIIGTIRRRRSNELVDPTTLVVRVLPPSGVVVEYTYGVDSNVYRDSKGVYRVLLPTSTDADVGIWSVEYVTTGTGTKAMQPTRVQVRSRLVPS
jgi:hypothetical protein